MADLTKYMSKAFTTHQVKIEEVENGLKITETFDTENVISFISFHAKPFLRSTNETEIDSFQILDLIGEIYNIPALATEFILIDLKGTVYIPGNATELIEYSVKLKPFRSFYELDAVLSIGEITADSSTVTVGLSSTGKNSVIINGSIYDRYILSDFPFIHVVEFTKILIVYAKPDSTVFYLAQGVEALSAVEPDYEGLFVARIIASIDGNIIEYPNYGVITEDSDTVVLTGNGTVGTPLKAEVKSDGLGFIPLSGTEVGKPVTGTIIANFDNYTFQSGSEYDGPLNRKFRIGIKGDYVDAGEENVFEFNPEEGLIVKTFSSSDYTFLQAGVQKFNFIVSGTGGLFYGFKCDSGGLLIQSNLEKPALIGSLDNSPFYTPLTYIQKIYADNPETLITVLNNADSTQLATIKGLLGIV